jgi:hypothetical protein
MKRIITIFLAALLLLLPSISALAQKDQSKVQRVILISVDGMHSIDLQLYVKNNPGSALAQLTSRGVTFPNAKTPLLGDSSPGLLSLVTGGTPAVTGIIYSPTFDRSLSPPTSKDCSVKGTILYFDEKSVKDPTRDDSGGGIDPEKLPRDPAKGCAPVFPHQLVRVNTLFEVVKASGGRTAWIDQHDTYNDLAQGPSGKGIDDSRALERKGTPQTSEGFMAQDGRRLELLLNQIRGWDSYGKNKVGVPKVFGMGFISFGAMQKADGYADGEATLADNATKATLDFVDKSLGRIISELKAQKLYDSTMIILSSKHGQSPIDVKRRKVVDRNIIRNAVNGVKPDLLAHASLDTIGLLWLKDSSKTQEVVAALRAKQFEAGIQKIYWGENARNLVGLPTDDSRSPDIVIQCELGAFYADNLDSPATKALLAEHGGMLDEDTNVPLVVSFNGGNGSVNRSFVTTNQVAPTILKALGIPANKLRAVQIERTAALPLK